MKEKKDLDIVFMGTPEFAAIILEKLILNNYSIKAVVTVPDKPAGRGQKLNESAVKKIAVQHNIEVLQPDKLRDESFVNTLQEINADLFIVIAFRMLPKVVWEMPAMGTFNLHASLLPEYRGAAPINWAIINGEKETGVTTFFIDEKIDTGEIILNARMTIDENETAGELHDRMIDVGSKVVVDTIELIREDKVKTIPQPDSELKPAPKIFKEDCRVSLNQSIDAIHNHIRGLSPYPAAWILLKEKNSETTKTVKLFKTKIKSRNTNEAIQLVNEDNALLLKTLTGDLIIEELQLEGKKRLPAKDFLLGFRLEEWEIVS